MNKSVIDKLTVLFRNAHALPLAGRPFSDLPMDGADYDTDSDDYSDNDEDYGDEGRVYRAMCSEGIIEE